MRARTAVRMMERPLRVTLLMTFSKVSSRYTKSKSWRTVNRAKAVTHGYGQHPWWHGMCWHSVMELFRLAKAFEIIESNHYADSTERTASP